MKAWEEVAGSGDTGLVTTSNNGRTPFVPDEYGNATVFGTTDNAQPTFPLDNRIVEFVQYGVLNGAFARGPMMPDALIEDINALPDWTGPTQVSGGAITAQWVVASGAPSGYGLQFTLNAGAAGDEAYFEQIVPVGGSENNYIGHAVMVTFAPNGNADSLSIKLQYLDVTGATVGSTVTTNSGAMSGLGILAGLRSLIGAQGTSARSLRIRIHFLRDAAAATVADICTIYDVRMAAVPHWLMLREYGGSTYDVPTTPPTPPTGFHSIYAKSSDSKLYSKSDAGTEYKLNNVIGTDVAATPHGAADHDDITRTWFLEANDATLDSGTSATLGTTPNRTVVVALADAATQGCYWTTWLPSDWTSGTLKVRPIWVPGSTDASSHAVRWLFTIKVCINGTDVTAAGTAVGSATGYTGVAQAQTANIQMGVEADTDTGITPANVNQSQIMVNLRRVGGDAGDSYVGVVNLMGVRIGYTASQ